MGMPTTSQRISGIVEPTVLLYMAISSFILVFLEFVILRRSSVTLSDVRGEAFSRFWQRISGPPDPNQPLQGSATLIPPLLVKAEGVVLDLGPGNGSNLQYFSSKSSIRRIYGIEPSLPLHPPLRKNVEKNNIKDKYQIVAAGAEKASIVPALTELGLLRPGTSDVGVFDTVVCIRVLCSVPHFSETVKGLHDLLKPGGRLLVCEHVVNPWRTRKGSLIARLWQKLLSFFGWTYFVGNCHLERDTASALRAAAVEKGGWEQVELETSFGWSALPYVSGALTKRKT